MLDGGARYQVISSLIRETINCGKSMLATSFAFGDDLGRNSNEGNTIFNFIQKDRLLAAVCFCLHPALFFCLICRFQKMQWNSCYILVVLSACVKIC